ncbi:hypothetical protein BHE74_00047387, partial [Ensete ventricosum]
VSIGEVDDRKYNAQSDLACLGYRVAHVVLGQTCMGRPCSPRVDVSRLIGRDDVVADVALGLAWHRQRAVTRFGWAKRHVGDEALMVMQSCYNSDSIMTIHRLAEVRECLCILRNMNFKFLCQGSTLITPSRTALDCRLMLSRRGSGSRFILRLASTGGESRPHRWRLTHGTIWWRSSGNVMGEWGSLQRQGLESPIFLHFPWLEVGLQAQVDCLTGEPCCPQSFGRRVRISRDSLGILSSSRVIKDMTDAWLVKAGLSPTPRGIAHRDKGTEPAETAESLDCPPTVRDLCEGPLKSRWSNLTNSTRVWIEGLIAVEYVWRVLNPSLAKWLYESSSKELMDQDAKSVIWVCVFQDIPPRFPISSYVPNLSSYPLQGLHFAGTLIDRVHDYRKDLKLVADSSRVELRDLRDSRHRLEDEVLSLTKGAEMLQSELKAEGDKAIVDYKKSRGFQSELEKMGQVIYEFGYWVALKHFQMKYPNSLVEEDPFTERPKDANVRMEVS